MPIAAPHSTSAFQSSVCIMLDCRSLVMLCRSALWEGEGRGRGGEGGCKGWKKHVSLHVSFHSTEDSDSTPLCSIQTRGLDTAVGLLANLTAQGALPISRAQAFEHGASVQDGAVCNPGNERSNVPATSGSARGMYGCQPSSPHGKRSTKCSGSYARLDSSVSYRPPSRKRSMTLRLAGCSSQSTHTSLKVRRPKLEEYTRLSAEAGALSGLMTNCAFTVSSC